MSPRSPGAIVKEPFVSLSADTHTDRDSHRLAAAARSILACPEDVALVVDGVADLAAGSANHLEMRDQDGRPVFSCLADTPLALAAHDGRGAVLTLRSGLGRPGSPDREARLILSGRLEAAGMEECPCCSEVRLRVGMHLDFVLLARDSEPSQVPAARQVRVPLSAFGSRAHDLNRGFLQRSVEHTNLCHQDELRRAIATRTDTRLGDVLGVHLTDLRTDRVVLQWVDLSGAHQTDLTFPRAATGTADLGELLRSELHAGLC